MYFDIVVYDENVSCVLQFPESHTFVYYVVSRRMRVTCAIRAYGILSTTARDATTSEPTSIVVHVQVCVYVCLST